MTLRSILSRLLAALVLVGGSAVAAYDDGHGKVWRQLTETETYAWQQVDSVCANDGATACNGAIGSNDFTGWVWATQQQVMDLFNYWLPVNPALPNNGQLSPSNPGVGGFAYFFYAEDFLSRAFAPTFSFCITYACGAAAYGWTSTLAQNAEAFVGSVGWNTTPVSLDGGFSVGGTAETLGLHRDFGVWLWQSNVPVPEPAAALLILAGLGSLRMWRLHTRK